MPPSDKPYRVLWGWTEENWQDFASFTEAWAFWSSKPRSRITNMENYDGAEGGNEDGLSEEERARVGQ